MDIQNAKYTKNNVQIIAVVDGVEMTIPNSGGNRFHAEIIRQVSEEGLVIADYVEPTPGPYPVSKYTIITRLDAAGKFADALTALKSDELLYEKWSAVSVIHSDDQPARDLFTAIGLEPDTILAKE